MNALRKIATATALFATAGASLAQGPKPLELIAFGGGGNWPVWAAQEKGLFAKNGIAVTLSFTPNSVEQIRNLMNGTYDLGTTAYDNVVAYQEGQGETELPVQPDLFAFMGGYSGSLRFVTQPDIKSYADLKGKTLGVDAATTGFAFILYKLAALNGLSSADYKVERLGGEKRRPAGRLHPLVCRRDGLAAAAGEQGRGHFDLREARDQRPAPRGAKSLRSHVRGEGRLPEKSEARSRRLPHGAEAAQRVRQAGEKPH